MHPSFHNIDYKECEKVMANMDQGDVVIRPSSKVSTPLSGLDSKPLLRSVAG